MSIDDSMTVFRDYLAQAFPRAEVSRVDYPVQPIEGPRGFAIDEAGHRRVVLVTEPFWEDAASVGLPAMLDMVRLKPEIERHEHVVGKPNAAQGWRFSAWRSA